MAQDFSFINKRLIQDPNKLKQVIFNCIIRSNPFFKYLNKDHFEIATLYFTNDVDNQPISSRYNYTLMFVLKVLPEYASEYNGKKTQWTFRFAKSPYGNEVFEYLGLGHLADEKSNLTETELRSLMLTLRDVSGIYLNSTGPLYPSNYTGVKRNRGFSIIHTGTAGHVVPAGTVYEYTANYKQHPLKAINYINNSRWYSFHFNTSYTTALRSDQM